MTMQLPFFSLVAELSKNWEKKRHGVGEACVVASIYDCEGGKRRRAEREEGGGGGEPRKREVENEAERCIRAKEKKDG